MGSSHETRRWWALGWGVCWLWMLVWVGPVVLLSTRLSISDMGRAIAHPHFGSALGLSLQTSLLSLAIMVVLGTPMAWILARRHGWWAQLMSVAAELPIVIPPAVVGLALLMSLGRRAMIGAWLEDMGISLAFETPAVVLAQVVVASPFYVQGAKTAFAKVPKDWLEVAQSLGASPRQVFVSVAIPAALPGLVTAASLAFARALGEFGATLLFAGNRVGHTQTMPLAIFGAMETDLHLAVVFALVLAATGLAMLVGLGILRRRVQERA